MGRVFKFLRHSPPIIKRMPPARVLRFEMSGKIDLNTVSSGFAKVPADANVVTTASILAEAPSLDTGYRPLFPVDYRLVIEKSPKTGNYIYKTLNSFTGEVVSQRPAEDVFKMSTSNQYTPGLIVNAKA